MGVLAWCPVMLSPSQDLILEECNGEREETVTIASGFGLVFLKSVFSVIWDASEHPPGLPHCFRGL